MVDDYSAEEILKLVGETMSDCRAKLSDMYGKGYTITDCRQITKNYGLFGLLKKDCVEVKYVVNRNREPSLTNVSNPDEVRRVRDELLRISSGGKTKQEIQLAELNSKLDDLTTQIANIPRGSAEEDNIESIERIRELLEDNEFTKGYINGIIARLKSTFPLDDLQDFPKVEQQVVDWIGESIEIAQEKAHRPPHVIVIVGPTGVGKTTTIAKLATQHIRLEKENAPKMCMITVDNTRAGAEDQLKQIGAALEIAVHKAINASDLKSVYDSVRNDFDIIYIDTSGYSPNDSEKIGALKTTLSIESLRPDIYLAVAASTKARDLKNIMQNYEPFDYNSVIVTKCDETTRFGNIISVFSEKRKSISYITDGQRIGVNIRKANVVGFLKRLPGFTVNRVHIEDKFGEDEDGRSD